MKKFKDFIYEEADDDFDDYKKTDGKKKNQSWKQDRKSKNKLKDRFYERDDD